MRKEFLMLAFAALALTAKGQTLVDGNKPSDNWSVGFNIGGITPLTHHAFWKNMRPNLGVEVDKQFTPVFGMGLEGMFNINTSESATAFDASNVSLLGRVNLFNWLGGFKGAPRLFDMELVGGAGWGHSYVNGDGDSNYLTSKMGLNFNFNLGEKKAWTVAFKPALVYNMEGDCNTGRTGAHFNANHAAWELTAGVVYHFKNSNGKHYMSLARAYDQREVDELNAKINDLRNDAREKDRRIEDADQKINDLKKQLEDCQNTEPEVKTVTVKENSQTLESVVTFRQGKTTIDASQQPNVERIATYLKNHADAVVSIKGYASPEGSVEVNAKIAQQRAEAVKNMLTSKYKIAASRITAEGQGVGNMFEEPDWNRVSICTIDKK